MKTLFGWSQGTAGAKLNILLGAQVYTLMPGAIMVLAGIGVFLFTRERYLQQARCRTEADEDFHQGHARPDARLPAVSDDPFHGARLRYRHQHGRHAQFITRTVYYVCHGDVAAGGTWNFWMGLVGNLLLGFCGIPVFSFVARWLGKKGGMITVQTCAIGGFIATWWLYNPAIQWLQVVSCGLTAFTGAGFWMLCWLGDLPHVIDYDENWQGGSRRAGKGSFAACASWILKLGVALGSWASGEILDQTGFKSTLGGNQTDHAIFMIRILLASIPIIGLVLSLAFLIRFPLTQQKMAEIRQKLEARRGTVPNGPDRYRILICRSLFAGDPVLPRIASNSACKQALQSSRLARRHLRCVCLHNRPWTFLRAVAKSGQSHNHTHHRTKSNAHRLHAPAPWPGPDPFRLHQRGVPRTVGKAGPRLRRDR